MPARSRSSSRPEPWEALAMGLEVETVEGRGEQKRKPVADYVKAR